MGIRLQDGEGNPARCLTWPILVRPTLRLHAGSKGTKSEHSG
jgi:hypothetical protein